MIYKRCPFFIKIVVNADLTIKQTQFAIFTTYYISVIYKCRKIAEDFPTALFLLILPPKKHIFLGKLIGKYIKVSFFHYSGNPPKGDNPNRALC